MMMMKKKSTLGRWRKYQKRQQNVKKFRSSQILFGEKEKKKKRIASKVVCVRQVKDE
jgi:hypothetical protein